MKDTNHIAAETVSYIPVSDLALSPMNPRQTVSDEEILALVASIESVGLIQSLAGFDTGERVEIVAGGRRLRALQALAENAADEWAGFAVPVRVTADRTEAQSWASTENIMRAELHPADEIRAFADLATTGYPIEKVAQTFGVTVRRVQQRMKLAGLPAPILDALRADKLTLDAAAAYTLAQDEAHALAVFEDMNGTYYGSEAYTIRRKLTAAMADGGGREGKFVGREDYEAAGGTITTDLFEDKVHFNDAALLTELATAKLEEIATDLRAEGWKWVETSTEDTPWDIKQKMGRTYAEPIGLTDEEQARYDDLAEKVEYGEATDEEQEEAEALSEKMDRPGPYSAEQMAHAGVFVTLDWSGKVHIEAGMVRPEDIDAAVEAGICRKSAHVGTGTTEKPKYPQALTDDMTRIRNAAIQRALAKKPELALDLLTFVLASDLSSYAAPVAVNMETMPNMPKNDMGLDEDARFDPTYTVRFKRDAGTVETFETFRASPKKQRNALLTAAIARGFGSDLHGNGTKRAFVDHIASMLVPNVRDVWTPNEAFFKRLTAAQLDEVFAEVLGKAPSAETVKMKKADKVAALALWFEDPDAQKALTADQKARVKAWHPVEMGFETTDDTVQAE
ncbi:ParB/RepB/Spo0J family partition protein [Roseobacter sp. HKCCA0434]|uniref:ParB/RepB/Spo0J family partition protein n=1 Tax=Roseobacter sp. HKCCA0434 TaxID=3079297 RepID=UPI002905A34C|nr:ParB/RepB/Spo0J family partition protein [Roseobacter sp. HKCCA0434]